jgi:RecJ-like exonuclease
MLSADTIEQARLAWSQGLRTYRTVESIEEIDAQNEILCPASEQAGKRTTCEKCKLCSGSKGKAQKARSVAIPVHGAGKKHFSTNSN